MMKYLLENGDCLISYIILILYLLYVVLINLMYSINANLFLIF